MQLTNQARGHKRAAAVSASWPSRDQRDMFYTSIYVSDPE